MYQKFIKKSRSMRKLKFFTIIIFFYIMIKIQKSVVGPEMYIIIN